MSIFDEIRKQKRILEENYNFPAVYVSLTLEGYKQFIKETWSIMLDAQHNLLEIEEYDGMKIIVNASQDMDVAVLTLPRYEFLYIENHYKIKLYEGSE